MFENLKLIIKLNKMTDSTTLPNANLPFGQIRTYNNFKDSMSKELKEFLGEKTILSKKKPTEVCISFKGDLRKFLRQEIEKHFPEDYNWTYKLCIELIDACIIVKSSCDLVPVNTDELTKEDNLKQLFFNVILKKLFDYEAGVMPRLFGLKPLVDLRSL